MIGHREFPAASYDRWKTRSPDDEYARYYGDEPECDHGDFDVDFYGVAHCSSCSERWTLTPEQLARYDDLQRRREEDWERAQRRERRLRLWRWLQARWRKWRAPKIDDEIPF